MKKGPQFELGQWDKWELGQGSIGTNVPPVKLFNDRINDQKTIETKRFRLDRPVLGAYPRVEQMRVHFLRAYK